MTTKFYSDNEDLQPFFEEINKYTNNIHSLNDGIDSQYIEQVEEDLKILFPKIYKDFLMACNGGELFIPGTVFAEIYHPNLGSKQRGVSYLNDSFRNDRSRPNMPANLLIIADLNYGDSICFELETNDGYDASVVQWDSESQSIARQWNGFVEFLMDILEEGSMLVDYDGNELDLDF